MSEKRSAATRIDQLDLFDAQGRDGVGARHGSPGRAHGGGGYLDVCTAANFEAPRAAPQKIAPHRDPRLADLARIGLQGVWLDVAEEVGVDVLLRIWRIIDASNETMINGRRCFVPIIQYRTFLRHQRNQYIRELSKTLAPKQIRHRVNRQLGESVSMRNIWRIVNGA
jgi:hypothetical protein